MQSTERTTCVWKRHGFYLVISGLLKCADMVKEDIDPLAIFAIPSSQEGVIRSCRIRSPYAQKFPNVQALAHHARPRHRHAAAKSLGASRFEAVPGNLQTTSPAYES